MAGRKRSDIGILDKAPAPKRAGYDEDTYSWAFEQAAFLRAGAWDKLDIEHLADEIEDVGKNEYSKLESTFRVLMLHLLKWDMQPDRRTKSWVSSIREQRRRVERLFRENPGLKARRDEAIANAFEDAVDGAIGETNLDPSRFPGEPPFSYEEMMTREIPWP